MTLSDFKVIFFWEYLHCLISSDHRFHSDGVLCIKGHLKGNQRVRALVALALGGGQGLLGW